VRSGRRPAGRRGRAGPVARYGAPAAFLLAATVAVLLIHAALGGKTIPSSPAPARPATTTAAVTTTTTSAPAKPTAPAAKYYAIQRGDTFGVVATKTGTTVQQLQALNPGVSSNALHVGQKIRVG
jgi:LysM repeat protein